MNLSLEPGEVLGLIGPNGAGKTTLFNVISGHVAPRDGRVELDGRLITSVPPHVRTRLGIGRTFQIPRPFTGMTVFENLLVAATYSRRNREPRVAAVGVLERLGSDALADRPVTSLSAAELKRLELARALATAPDYLLLDEIFAGLDPAEKARTRRVIQEITRERNLGVLLVEHDLKTVFRLSHRVLMLHFGDVLAEGPPEAVARDPQVVRAYIGQVAV